MVATAASIHCLMLRPSQSQVEGFDKRPQMVGESRAGLSFVASLLKLSHMSLGSWITCVTSGMEAYAATEGWSPEQNRVGLVSMRQYNRAVQKY